VESPTKNIVAPAKNSTVISIVQRPSRVNSDVNDHDNQLHCELFGGPYNEVSLRDMMYWRTDEFAVDDSSLPSSSSSSKDEKKRYLIFEPDEAGFSNVRLSFENVVALAKITHRILVLPPATRYVQLRQGGGGENDSVPSYFLADFFKIRNLPVITMQEFLETVPLTYRANGTVAVPPSNRTNWDGRLGNAILSDPGDEPLLYGWLNSTMRTYEWEREKHIVVVGNGTLASQALAAIVLKESIGGEVAATTANNNKNNKNNNNLALLQKRVVHFFGKPPAVDASLTTRLQEFMGNRTALRTTAVYDDEPFMMIQGHESTNYRPLIQFYAHYFFEDWQQSLRMKRYIRDNLRFADFIQCAAARIVQALREHARRHGASPDGSFDTMHIRRKDFRTLPNYKAGTVPAANLVRDQYLVENRTVYIATDENDPAYFQPLRQHYHVYLLQDFMPLVKGIDPNYYGMIEQLVCAKGDLFVGTFYSTFTAYITRLRGYNALKDQKPGHLLGSLSDSEYFGHKGVHRHILRQYNAPTYQLWTREWPMAWRDIDHDLNM
jgi:GDP-fucose protein O-fucosyltransferase